MLSKSQDISALKFGIMMNFPIYTGEENTIEAIKILESLEQDNGKLIEALKVCLECLDQDRYLIGDSQYNEFKALLD